MLAVYRNAAFRETRTGAGAKQNPRCVQAGFVVVKPLFNVYLLFSFWLKQAVNQLLVKMIVKLAGYIVVHSTYKDTAQRAEYGKH